MKLKYFLSLVLFVYFLTSCKDHGDDRIEVIDFKNSLTQPEKIPLSKIARKVEYIILESKRECYIGRIEEVKFFDNKIFILDSKRKSIFIFSDDGKYLNKVHSVGKGPHEYGKIICFDISPVDSNIYIYDGVNSRLLEYDQEGIFINSWKTGGYISDITFVKNTLAILYPFPNYAFNNNYSVSFYTPDYQYVKSLLINNYMSEEEAYRTEAVGNYLFDNVCDTLCYWEYKKDIIYHLTEETYLKRYKLLLPDPIPRNAKKTGNYTAIYRIQESCGYLFFLGDYKRNAFRALYFKNDHKTIVLSKKYADEFGYGLINDIDGGFDFWPEGITADGTKGYSTFDLLELQEYLKRNNNKDKMSLRSGENNGLKRLTGNATIQENECIMLVTFK